MPNIFIFKTGCPYCKKAADRLQSLVAPTDLADAFEMVEVSDKEDRAEANEFLWKRFGVRATTVPQIICNGKYIGGWSDLDSLTK